jgi:hypothetical protein
MMLICPEHPRIFAREGWGRERIQAATYKVTRVPVRTLMLDSAQAEAPR